MLADIGHLLPIACALALSSVPIMATVVMLLSPNRRRAAIPFLIGWIIGIAIVLSIFTVLANLIPPASKRNPDAVLGTILILAGVGLIVLGIWRLRHPGTVQTTDPPKWLNMLEKIGPFSAFGLAFALNFRPKAVLLSIAAGVSLAGDNLSTAEYAIAIGMYTLIAASTVIVPIIYTLAVPSKAETMLLRVRTWIIANSRYVTIVILIMIGVVIIGSGIERF